MVHDTTSSSEYGEVHYVAVSVIRVNHKKLRKLSQAKILRYAVDYERGDDFPPIAVDDCGDFFTVRDGRHRLQAQLIAGFATVAIQIRAS
jgi:hypothetical protein